MFERCINCKFVLDCNALMEMYCEYEESKPEDVLYVGQAILTPVGKKFVPIANSTMGV